MTAVDPRPGAPLPGASSTGHTGVAPSSPGARGIREIFAAYLALTKPRIIELLLVTTVPVMFMAAGGLPGGWLVLATLIGGSLAAGGANTLNCYIDRDIDRLMERTGHRPLVTGAVTPRAALVFGLVLSAGSVGWLAATTNLLAAGLALAAIAFYVLIYTMLLKRRTPQNIVWGGAAGCFPVLIGWAATTGSLSWSALVLFAVVFFWTPPHYWPLSLRYRADYEAAGVPMLPVVAAPSVVSKQIVRYSYVMVAVSLLLIPVGPTGPVYAVSATVLGAAFLLEAHRLRARVRRREPDLMPMRLFHWSITYLSLLFLAVAIDPFLF